MFNKIDTLTETEFVEVFGNIFENASWIAVKLYKQKPFNGGTLSIYRRVTFCGGFLRFIL